MKKSDKLLAKLGKSLDPERRPPRPASGRAPAADPAPAPADPTPSPSSVPPVSAAAAARTTADASKPASAESPPAAATPDERHAAAEACIKRHVPYALGAGLIPLPLLDIAAISGVQIKLIADLSAIYGVPFAANQAKAVVAALLGGAGSLSLATGLLGSLVKILPGAGYILGAGAVPLTAGALTYAVGHVFRAHFESGGTLLDFNVDAAKRTFLEKVAEGRATLKSL